MNAKNKRIRLGHFRWNRLVSVIAVALLLYKTITFVVDCATNKKTTVALANLASVELETETTEALTFTTEHVTAAPTTAPITEIATEPEVKIVCYSSRLQRDVTADEFYYLTMICCSESGCESYEGKVAVVASVLNRMEDSAFPNDVYGVIFQPYQFSSASNGRFFYNNGATELRYEDLSATMIQDAESAVKAALSGDDPTRDYLGGALYFYNPSYCSYEELEMRASISSTYTIGNHIFYRVWDTY